MKKILQNNPPTLKLWRTRKITILTILTIVVISVVASLFIFNKSQEGAKAAVPVIEGSQATSSGATATSSLTLVAPSGITAGEFLLVIVGSDDNTATAQFSIADTDWTKIGEGGDDIADAHIAAFWKEAAGGDGNAVVAAATANEMFGWYIRISGATTTSPIHISNFTQSTGSSNSHVIPEVTTTIDDTLAIYGLGFDGGDGAPYSITGTGWSEQAEQTAGTGQANASGAWGTKSMSSSGGTGTATVGSTVSDSAAYFQLAIKGRNLPPVAPTLHDLPFSNEKTGDSTPSFEFTGSDSDGTADITYQIQVDDDYAFGSMFINCESDTSCTTGAGSFTNTVTGGDTDPFNEGEKIRFTPTTATTTGTTYYWRVRAEDNSGTGGSGTYGVWSSIQSVTYISGIDPSQWFQTTTEQFDTPNGDTLTDVEAESGGVKLKGW